MTTYRALLATLDAWFARGRERAGPGVVPCERTCTACCHGPFDISPADAALVAEGVAALPAEDAEALRGRAEEQLGRCAERLPTWGPPWDVEALDEQTFDGLTEQLAQDPCPALEADGGCAVYDTRPATCRMTGLSMDAGAAGRLDNECPIQERFPGYAGLAPEPFALMAFEEQAARHDEEAHARGHRTTTVAGALVWRSSTEGTDVRRGRA
jgi:Fe-S-cluster containining protein